MKLRVLPTIRSPSSDTLGRSRRSIDIQLSPPRIQTAAVKTALIARKINPEDLYGSIIKQNNVSVLTQIKEEKNDNPETLSQIDMADSEVFQEPKVHKSVFQTDVLISPKYREYGVGPLYKDSKLIKHSIIGTPQNFEKYQKSLQKLNIRTILSTEFDAPKNEMVVPRTLKISTSIVLKDEAGPTLRPSNTQPDFFPRRVSIRNKRKEEVKRETLISRENLIGKIEEIKRDQEDFYRTQTTENNRLTLREKLSQTKEERRMKSFTSTMDNWQKTTSEMAKRVGRSPETSVMSRNQSFRGKREIADLIEEGKSDSEKLGPYLWHVSLRKYGDDYEKGNHTVVTKDLPQGFQSKEFNKTISHFQLIRKPVQINSGMTTTTNFEQPKQIDRTYNEYLSSKFSKLGKLLKKIKPATDMGEIGTLMVEGKNKLDLETSFICREDTFEDVFSIPKNFTEPKNEEKIDQTIHEFYERTIVSRNGH